MNMNSEKLIKITPSLLYFGLCTIILIFDFNIWIEGSAEYPRFYIMPIVISLILFIILIIYIKHYSSKKELHRIEEPPTYNRTLWLFIIYLAVIWFPRQFMIWKFFITFEKIPILYLIVTQIVLVDGFLLSEFGLTKQFLIKGILLGCFIAFIDISIMTIISILLALSLEGAPVLLNIELFELTQFITFPWQLLAVGISEELFFRGYFFTKFRKSGKNFWHSAILTSFLFTIFHIPWLISIDFTFNTDLPYIIWRVINTFPFGLICCVLYEKTKSLTASIVYHGFSNSLTTFIIIGINSVNEFLYELIFWICAFFTLLFIAFLAPKISKLFGFEEKIT